MVDRNLLRERFVHIVEALGKLKKRRSMSLEVLQKDTDAQDIILRNLQIAIQACIDIGSHIISDEGWEFPGSLSGIFDTLYEKKVMGRSLAERLISMVGFRNLIIHEYAKVDLKKVHTILKTDLADFDRFLRVVSAKYKL